MIHAIISKGRLSELKIPNPVFDMNADIESRDGKLVESSVGHSNGVDSLAIDPIAAPGEVAVSNDGPIKPGVNGINQRLIPKSRRAR